MGPDHVELASSEEAQQQRVGLVPETLQHQFGQVVPLGRPVLHHGPQVLQGGRPPLVRLVQLVLGLEETELHKHMRSCGLQELLDNLI